MTTMTVVPLSRRIGARIDGVDLTAVDDDTFAAIDAALLEHQVIFFRGAHLSSESQAAFAGRWGPVSVYPVAKVLGANRTMSTIEDTAESPPDADGWHTDVTWLLEPPRLAVLSAEVIPPAGGDTMWASLYAAYDQLSPTLASICEQLSVRHERGRGFDEVIGRIYGDEIVARLRADYPPVEHPLVRTHPVTGRKSLFLAGGFMQQIVGMHQAESDALLGHLKQLVDDPNNQVRWTWQPGDVAVWDEVCTNHRALSDHYPQHRRMRRCTVDGERPFFDPAAAPPREAMPPTRAGMV